MIREEIVALLKKRELAVSEFNRNNKPVYYLD